MTRNRHWRKRRQSMDSDTVVLLCMGMLLGLAVIAFSIMDYMVWAEQFKLHQ